MHQPRKGQQWYFGMTLHLGMDSKTGRDGKSPRLGRAESQIDRLFSVALDQSGP